MRNITRRKGHDESGNDEEEGQWQRGEDDKPKRYSQTPLLDGNALLFGVPVRKWLVLIFVIESVVVVVGWAWLFHAREIGSVGLSQQALVDGLSFAVVTDVSRPYFHAIREYYDGTGLVPRFYTFIDESWKSEEAEKARSVAEKEGVTILSRRFCPLDSPNQVFANQRNTFCNVLSTVVDDPSWATLIIEDDTYPIHDVEEHMLELRRLHAWPRGESGVLLHHMGIPGFPYRWSGSGSLARSWSAAMRNRLWSDYCLDPEGVKFCSMGMDTSWETLYMGVLPETRALLYQHTGNLSGKPLN